MNTLTYFSITPNQYCHCISHNVYTQHINIVLPAPAYLSNYHSSLFSWFRCIYQTPCPLSPGRSGAWQIQSEGQNQTFAHTSLNTCEEGPLGRGRGCMAVGDERCRRYLVQVAPVPHKACEEADCKHPFELDKPGDHTPELGADDCYDEQDAD